jgi:transposase
MSIRCKVCNASKIQDATKIIPDVNWECPSCGNLLDFNGYIATN